MPRDAKDNADLIEMLRKGHALVREGQAMIRAAENMGGVAGQESPSDGERSTTVDFGSLPGKSALSRAEALYMGRRIRDRLFPRDVFSEPSWDLLLGLFLGSEDEHGVLVEPILNECGVPRATGLRYIAHLQELGLVKEASAPDAENKLFLLSPIGLRLMKQFFDVTQDVALIPEALRLRRSA